MAPGARSKFGALMFEPEVFRKQCAVLKKVLVILLGLFSPPTVIRRPGIVPVCFIAAPGSLKVAHMKNITQQLP